MPQGDDRPRFIERATGQRTPEEAKRGKSTAMIAVGAIALLLGLLNVGSGSAVALLVGLLGVGLLVGGLVLR